MLQKMSNLVNWIKIKFLKAGEMKKKHIAKHMKYKTLGIKGKKIFNKIMVKGNIPEE